MLTRRMSALFQRNPSSWERVSFCPIWKMGSGVTPLPPALGFLPLFGFVASSDLSDASRSSRPPRSSPVSSSSASGVEKVAESVMFQDLNGGSVERVQVLSCILA